MDFVSKLRNKTINKIDTFFLSRNDNFGNNLVTINNCIFYCKIIGCHKIILNKHQFKRRWLIKKPVILDKLNIIIMQGSNINCEEDNVLCLYEKSWLIYYPKVIFPQVIVQPLREEILRNLPYVNIEPDSLYIHIRGGNVFKASPPGTYTQPPLCFYKKIIDNNKFKNIYIISMDKTNIIINALINKYKNIILNKNNFEYDIALLSHAYYIAISVSSFALSSIKLNNNLKEIWEFDITRMSEKIHFLHHHLFKFRIQYKIHTMKPSEVYATKMFEWRGNSEQKKLMLEDKCPNEFVLTKQNI